MLLTGEANLQVYNAAEVASYYAELDYLTPCEQLLFESYIQPGVSILDLGVGGGRTTPYLSRYAAHYVGVDYASEMVEACRRRFQGREFLVADAANLSMFPNASFDVVVMAFNVIDYIIPDDNRARCFREIYRLLKPNGIFIFSSHNPRSIFVRPAWTQERLREFAVQLIGKRKSIFHLTVSSLTCAKALLELARAVFASTGRVLRRTVSAAFWEGEGYLVDTAHGGLITHYWIPERAIATLKQFHFSFLRKLGDDYPRSSRPYITDWYYYVFAKSSNEMEQEYCA